MSHEMKELDWRRIFNSAPDPVFLHDRKFRLILANHAYFKCADLTEQEALGRPYWEVFPKNGGPLHSCVQALATPGAEEEEEIRLPDGKVYLSHSAAVMDKAGNYLYSRHNLTDITALKRAEQRIERLNVLYRTISLGNQALVRAGDEITLSQAISRILVTSGGYRACWAGLKGENAEKTIHPVAAEGIEIHKLRELGLTWADNEQGQTPAAICIRTEKPVRCHNLPDEIPQPYRQLTLDLGIVESLSLPLFANNRVIGAMTVSASTHDLLGEEEGALLLEMAGDLAFGIDKLRSNAERIGILEQLEHSLDHAVTAIAATVEMRDPYTAGHQRRVARLAAAIAEEMGFSPQQAEGIHIAGVVHDIGKIHVPAEILSSPAKLSEAEFAIIKTHCQSGHEILSPIDFPWPIAEIVRQHHEKLDGSGYPRGLKGDAILIEAKILCVADIVEAMASHRPYRPGFGIFPALQEISRNKGRLYDQNVVQATLKLFLEKGFEL